MHFTILTPSFNQLNYLKRCVASVRDQVAPEAQALGVGCEGFGKGVSNAECQVPNASISIHHYVQDACSTDGTREFLKEHESMIRALGSGRWALGEDFKTGAHQSEDRVLNTQPNAQNLKPKAYSFRFASEVDDGMYDAINKGVAFVGNGHWALGVRRAESGEQRTEDRERRAEERGPRVEAQSQEPNAQRPDAGGIISWLNCDEQYLPGTLEKVAAFFEGHPDVDILFGGMLMVDEEGKLLACRKAMPMRKLFLEASYLYNYSCAMFFRESLWRKLGGFDVSFKNAGDEDLIRRALKLKAKCGVLNDYLSVFSYGGSNLSSDPVAVTEQDALKRSDSFFAQAFKLPINLLRLSEKFLRGGHVQRGSVDYEIFVKQLDRRTCFDAVNPSCRWPDAKKPYLMTHRLDGR